MSSDKLHGMSLATGRKHLRYAYNIHLKKIDTAHMSLCTAQKNRHSSHELMYSSPELSYVVKLAIV